MNNVIDFCSRKYDKSWESLDTYRKFLETEDEVSLLQRLDSDGALSDPCLLNWQMKICVYEALINKATSVAQKNELIAYKLSIQMQIEDFFQGKRA